MPKKRKYKYDYYTICLPSDLFNGESAEQDFLNYAIETARENARLYCIPCEWNARIADGIVGEGAGLIITVRRKRHNNKTQSK